MNKTTTVAVDRKAKMMAAKRAKEENIPVSIVVSILLRDYANGNVSIGSIAKEQYIHQEIQVDAETQKAMDNVVSKYRKYKK